MYTPEQQSVIEDLHSITERYPEAADVAFARALLIILDKLEPLAGGAEVRRAYGKEAE